MPLFRNLVLYPLLTAIMGILVSLSGIHRFHDCDSLLPILLGLYKWEPFYWGQDRYGMLIPLLAAPFHHPLTHLLVQTGLSAWGGLAAIYLIARYLCRDASWAAVGSAAIFCLLLAAPPKFLWMYLTTWEPFGPSLALGFAALLLMIPNPSQRGPRPIQAIAAVICALLAAWLNAAIGPFLFPMALATGLIRWALDPNCRGLNRAQLVQNPHAREMAFSIALTAFATISAFLLQDLSPYRSSSLSIPPPDEWRHRLSGLLPEMAHALRPEMWACLLASLFASSLILLLFRSTRRPALRSLSILLAVALASFAYAGAMAAATNGYWRYAIPAMIVVHVAVVGTLFRPVALTLRPRTLRSFELALAAACLAAVPIALGPPSIAGVRRDLDALPCVPVGVIRGTPDFETPAGPRAEAVVQARCTHVAGDGWRAAPVVFSANLRLADRGEARIVWGLNIRGQATAEKWKAVPRESVRVATFPADRGAGLGLNDFGFPLRPAENVGPLRVYVPANPRRFILPAGPSVGWPERAENRAPRSPCSR